MFKRPEEILLILVGIAFLAITYFLAGWATAASLKYTLMITGGTLLWLAAFFWLWTHEKAFLFYPVLLGLFVACWCPWLDWFALRHTAAADTTSMIVLNKPWYATWTFKAVLIALPIIGGYAWEWQRRRKRKLAGKV